MREPNRNMPTPYESVVDRQIRLAQERGVFDDLPGKGKPLPGLEGPHDEMWWVKGLLEREGLSSELLLPPSIQLRKEIDRLPEALRGLPSEGAVRAAVAELNMRIVDFMRAPVGPHVRMGRVDPDLAVEQWRSGRTQRDPQERPEPPTAASQEQEPLGQPWWRRLGRRATPRRVR